MRMHLALLLLGLWGASALAQTHPDAVAAMAGRGDADGLRACAYDLTDYVDLLVDAGASD